MNHREQRHLTLTGLELGPPQVLGAIRLVPLLRARPTEDLRLGLQPHASSAQMVALDARDDGLKYVSFIPHGLMVRFSEDGRPVDAPEGSAALGSWMSASGKKARPGRAPPVLHRMVKRAGADGFRMLPLHLAMEGFLSLCFAGPDIAWPEYSQRAVRRGLDPRLESSWSGHAIFGLEEALRLFEIHEGQVGMLVFVADALASAFVVPHQTDYRLLHRTMIEDFFGELIFRYAGQHPKLGRLEAGVDASEVHDLDGLERAIEAVRGDWSELAASMASGLSDQPARFETIRKAGPFVLERFVGDLECGEETHIGELIRRRDGTVEYLKTFRLSAAQVRRARLLELLATHDWHLDRAAAAEGQSRALLLDRIQRAGFEYLIRPEARGRRPRA